MVNPVTALTIFFILTAVLVIIFIPKAGLFSLWKRVKSDKTKILIEDGLKFIYDLHLKNRECNKELLSEALKIKNSNLVHLIETLVKMNFINLNGNRIVLTDEGKGYAIKVVRIHRLLEKYFAEETSIKEDNWHIEAEDKEHHISDAEAEFLSARLGNPLTDPHGDPIPDKSGEYYQPENKVLLEMKIGETGAIIHIEDEPPEKYSKILLLNLHVGSRLKILNINDGEISVISEGKQISLPSALAENIYLAQPETEITDDLKRLSELKSDEEAMIVGISKAMRGQQRRRLLDFGFVPGTKISVRLVSLSNDPIAYDIRNTTVALRRQQADLVFIKSTGTGAEYGRN